MRTQCQFTVKRSAVPPKCAVRDGVELLVLAAGDVVGSVASKGRAKDAKYRHKANRKSGERKSGMGIVDHRDNEKSCGNPHSCTENTESDSTSNHLNDLHNPMRRQCQFTVKRFRVNDSNMGLEPTTLCMVLSRSMNRRRLN